MLQKQNEYNSSRSSKSDSDTFATTSKISLKILDCFCRCDNSTSI
jgi:hypothetical protein